MQGPGSETTPPPASSGSTAKPEYAFSCDGTASTKTLNLANDVAPRCIGAGPDSGTFSRDCGSTCAKQDVAFRYEPPAMRCGSKDLFFSDGSACQAQSTHGDGGMLQCTGNDCDSLYPSKADCEAARSQCPR